MFKIQAPLVVQSPGIHQSLRAGLMTEKPVLTIRLLNTFSVRFDDREIEVINKPRLQTLLAYFLLHQGIPISRQQLAFLFWPDTSERQSRGNLRQLIHRLRTALPVVKDCIKYSGNNLVWDCKIHIWFDVTVFEELAQKTNDSIALQQAEKVYAGDLMPGFYDDWVLTERERLNQKFIQVLDHLVDLYDASGNYQRAVDTLQRLQTQDTLREDTYRRMMSLYAKMGDLAGVHRTYKACKDQLKLELGLDLSPPTQELYHNLIDSRSVHTTTQTDGRYPLVGRDKEWADLLAVWSAGMFEKYRLVMITGEAGIGKTRLVEELLLWSKRDGFQQLVTHCYTADSLLAFAPIITWLHQMQIPDLDDIWLREISRLLPELQAARPDLGAPAPLTEPWQRQRLFEALRRFILSSSQPVLLVIDDIQWCDSESLDWLYYLLRADWQSADTDIRQVILVATLRREELSENTNLQTLLSRLTRNDQLVEIGLDPLNAAASTQLATEVAGVEINNAQADWVFRESEGNPFFIVEIVRESLRILGNVQSPLQRDLNSINGSGEMSIPPTVRSLILYRISRLSTGARDLIEIASVIGHIVDTKLLKVAFDRTDDELGTQLDELWRAGLLHEHGNYAYDFSHDKIGEVVYSELNPAHRRLLHRRVAEALIKISDGRIDRLSGQIAWHYHNAGEADLAVDYYWRAAQSARDVFGNQKAIEQLQKALELLPEIADPTIVRNWLIQIHSLLGDLYFLTGHYGLAFQAYETVLQIIAPDEMLLHTRLLRKKAKVLIRNRKFTEAQLALESAETFLKETDLPEDEKQHEFIETQVSYLEFYFWNNNIDQLNAELENLLPQIEQTDSLDLKLKFYITISQTSFSWSGFSIRDDYLVYPRLAMRIALRIGEPDLLAGANYGMGSTLVWFGDFKQAEEYLQQSLKLARQTGNLFLELRSMTYLSFVNRRFGNTEFVRDYADASQKTARILNRLDFLGVALGNLAWWYWRQENVAQAETLSRQALDMWAEAKVEHPFRWVAIWPLFGAYTRLGKIEQAMELVDELTNPNQMKVDENLSAQLLGLQKAYQDGDSAKIWDQFNLIIEIAGENGFL